ncbi:MAG: hypothetical protein A3I66_06185 [Burkholderiales bacterium RIFCSPLOWO2_02_FULL_57_36]|nr:MAG: hypothetical protein A3I66_06185 [Burkholderiales bacterium RIFCSPLOWO2_02_FULL_57_36]
MITRLPMQRAMTRRRTAGQSLIEYLVVLMVGVIVLVTGTDPPIQKLATAIRDYYTDYSYAISISSMPNCFNSVGLGPVTVGVDKCIDLKDPEWPVDVSFD